MYPPVLIETNKLWNNPWIEFGDEEKIETLRVVILNIAEHLNTTESQIRDEVRNQLEDKVYVAGNYATKELVEDEINDIEETIKNTLMITGKERAQELEEIQKVIRGIKDRLEKLEKC